ncbi:MULTISPECIES: hypothetical protein [Archaeoglobus]|uniref:Uridylate kinase n=3 Tax=Archaeoglobus fulgidus TaxID=2234 RepID=O29683_ARCFU|nr:MULTISPECIES: hypothetical protein [Archaeoglobus]AAB90667.1 conserved hypothetical protein [Archaeoglobus fulgidus DSM 4304]AIG97449.1 putative archaeal kinase [Archaeoglobus fulgidus DSM 8774]KUJ93081.1 MAG: hypothetical protein XD40_1709 [Archaeoglobus fulgidus]KUK06820.1 MAG: hypothetical protein XD48_0930 [Archaeoglobus fulgidus]MDI3498027.1 5-(aminomethyl)-3-furanmethanol phosphate kinase [Archaeoglobus sp.]
MIVKIGGSVADRLEVVFEALENLQRVYAIPGGWIFADLVRKIDAEKRLSSSTSHWMAITAMSAYGFYMAETASRFGFKVIEPEDFNFPDAKAVLLPYRLLRKYDELPHSWEVTSDSIAVWIAAKAGFTEIVKVTAAGGVKELDGKIVEEVRASELKTDVVDGYTPKLLVKYGINMFVCSPEELKNYILRGRGRGTLIVGGER